jgi:putative salt-induced outer membrane protein
MLASVALILPVIAKADTVVLKNGDHLTGTVKQLADGKLTLTTKYAGDVAIAFDEVSSVKFDKPLVLPVQSGKGKRATFKKTEITAIDRTDSGLDVTTASGTQHMTPKDVAILRNAADQQAYEASLRPGWLHNWTSTANINFALARGNSDTTTFGGGATAVRATATDKTSLYYSEIYAHDNIAKSTTADNLGAGARYDHNLNPKIFLFGTGDFFEDALQELDLRSVLGGGFGWHAIAGDKQQLDVLAGLVWTHESYSTVPGDPTATPPVPPTPPITNSFAAFDLGQQYTRKLGAASVFTEQAYFFPNLQDTGQYRFTANTTLATKIKSFLSWQTTASDVYVSNPPAGTKDNDLILTTGLGFTFTRK